MQSIAERNLEESKLLNINLYIFVEITSFLDVKSVILLSSASKDLLKRIFKGEFWRHYQASQGKKLYNLKPPELKALEFYTKLYKLFQTVKTIKLGMLALEASSTDYDQSINSVLSEDKHKFWSSLGSDTTTEKEYLLFSFPELSVVKSVQVEFFNAGGIGHDQEYYLSNDIVVMLGLNEEDWFYETKPFPVNNKTSCTIPIQQDGWGVARCIKIIFNGKLGLQDSDNKYYVAVESVRAFGYALNLKIPEFQSESTLLLESMCNFYNISLTEEELMKNQDPKYYLEKLKSKKLFADDDSAAIIQKYRELLQTNAEAKTKWNLLQKNKSVLSKMEVFEFILDSDKDFAKEYFNILHSEQKRDYLTLQETYLAVMVSVNLNGLSSQIANREAAFNLIDYRIFETFRFYTIDKSLIERICDRLKPDKLQAKKSLLDKFRFPEESIYVQSNKFLGILLPLIIVISNESTNLILR